VIETLKLTKIYGAGTRRQVDAAKDVDLKIEDRTFVALHGPSGCGKTTVLSMVGLLLTPTSGKVIIGGKDVSAFSDHWKAVYRRENIGFIFQHINLMPGYTAMENVIVPLLCRDELVTKYKERAEELFEKLGIQEKMDHHAERLSGGEQQRVAIARALISDPRIILADEPTVFVDAETNFVILDMLNELRKQGKTVIIATHDAKITKMCNVVYTMEKGRLKIIEERHWL
jgi:putative ABC transport system ATP-binding protein